MRKMVPEQMDLSRELPVVVGSVDYQEFTWRLVETDRLLRETGIENDFVRKALSGWEADGRARAKKKGRKYREAGGKQLARLQKMFRLALRCTIARMLTEKEYRPFSIRLPDSTLLQWFCGVERFEVVRVPGKSSIERYDKMVKEEDVSTLVNRLNILAVGGQVGLKTELDLEAYFSDSTCVKAAIHFPVDWILLRDGVRTLVKAILVIRKHGLKHRMPEPETFLRQINGLCIGMSQSRRCEDSRKKRKKVLRQMKRLNRIVMAHAQQYREKLSEGWQARTDLKAGEVALILKRIDGVLERLPVGIKQAHERIIGERQVLSKDKILSLYERDIHVVVRGKADAEVEFGNTMWLGEQSEGLIVDWKLLQDKNPGDTKLFRASMKRIQNVFGCYPKSVAGDRGLWSEENKKWLKEEKIFNALCPRDVGELRECLRDDRFVDNQKRRSQTEGRIGIMKNDFLGRPLRSKGFEHRKLAVTWAVLAHNLWLVTGLRWAEEKEKKKAA